MSDPARAAQRRYEAQMAERRRAYRDRAYARLFEAADEFRRIGDAPAERVIGQTILELDQMFGVTRRRATLDPKERRVE